MQAELGRCLAVKERPFSGSLLVLSRWSGASSRRIASQTATGAYSQALPLISGHYPFGPPTCASADKPEPSRQDFCIGGPDLEPAVDPVAQGGSARKYRDVLYTSNLAVGRASQEDGRNPQVGYRAINQGWAWDSIQGLCGILYRGYVIGPTRFLIWDPCLLNLPKTLTVAQVTPSCPKFRYSRLTINRHP